MGKRVCISSKIGVHIFGQNVNKKFKKNEAVYNAFDNNSYAQHSILF